MRYLPGLSSGGSGRVGFYLGANGAISIKNFKAEKVNGNPGIMTNMASDDIVKDTP
mgnify:CR=1 FL=1